MRVFQRPSGLDRLSLPSRVVYSVFSIFMLVGAATCFWLYADDDLGTDRASAVRYYLGASEHADEATAPGEADGPALELPVPPPAAIRIEKPARQVIETLHFHLFSVSVCFLIVAHIFIMSGLPGGLKAGVIGLGGLSTLAHLLVPPAIRFGLESFAILMFPSALLMGGTWILMTAGPVIEMWVVTCNGRRSE